MLLSVFNNLRDYGQILSDTIDDEQNTRETVYYYLGSRDCRECGTYRVFRKDGEVLNISKLTNAEAWEVASRIRQSDIWVLEDCARLCALAGLSEQWQEAGAEEFESLVQRAADILGVDIF